MPEPLTRLEAIEDRFLDVVLDKAPLWGLIGAGAIAVIIAVEQIILAVTR
jgi:hypothetical protein